MFTILEIMCVILKVKSDQLGNLPNLHKIHVAIHVTIHVSMKNVESPIKVQNNP